MLPGVIAGHYHREEAEVDIAGLCERAYVELQPGTVARFDARERKVALQDGTELAYDLVSFNVGSRIESGIPGAANATAVKPFEGLLERLQREAFRRVAIAGGAGGAEIAMALRFRGAAVTLYAAQPLAPEVLAARAEKTMRRMGVDYRPG